MATAEDADQAAIGHRETGYGDEATVPGRRETAYADEPKPTGEREAEYQDPGRVGDDYDDAARLGGRGPDGLETRTDVLDESGPDIARAQQTGPMEDEPLRAPSDGNLAPGQAHDPVAALWATDLVERYRTKWRDLQLEFVDDPKHAMDAAASLVDEAVASLTNNLNAQKRALGGWQADRGEDTEVMRVALRRYRDFLDRLLGL
jgi:hypothetical protein